MLQCETTGLEKRICGREVRHYKQASGTVQQASFHKLLLLAAPTAIRRFPPFPAARGARVLSRRPRRAAPPIPGVEVLLRLVPAPHIPLSLLF